MKTNHNSTFFSSILTNAFTGIDSSTWMIDPLERQNAFLNHLQSALDESGAAVWTTDHCLQELRGKLSDPDLASIAANALRFIEGLTASGQLKIYEYGQLTPGRKAFADPTFLSALLTKRPDCPLGLITQDGDLAASAVKLEELRAVMGKKIYIYRINQSGLPVRFRLFQTGEGEWISPKRSGLKPRFAVALSESSSTPRLFRTIRERDTVYGSCATPYELEELLHKGGESSIYTVKNIPQLVVKLFHAPSRRTEDKCRLLVSSRFSAYRSASPLDLVYDDDGSFRGYTMPRLHGCTLEQLMTPTGRSKLAPDWNRLDFARAAFTICRLIENLQLGGLLMLDVHPSNLLFEYDLHSGRLNPEAAWILDLDSAQFGSDETGILSSDSLSPAWSAPELLCGAELQQPPTSRTLVYSLAITAFQCIMAGLHPFRSAVGIAVSPEEAIRTGQFPYGSRGRASVMLPPSAGCKLWSNLGASTKTFFLELFQAGGRYYALSDRPTLRMLTKELQNYEKWLQKDSVLVRYPEVLSLQPLSPKPFYTTCANDSCRNKEREFPITRHRADGRYYCPQCREAIRQRAEVAPVIPMPERSSALSAPVSPLPSRFRELCTRLFA